MAVNLMAKDIYCIGDNSSMFECFKTKRGAQKALAKEVRAAAKACRRAHRRCATVGTVREGGVEIKIGGRQGYHMWNRFVLNAAKPQNVRHLPLSGTRRRRRR